MPTTSNLFHRNSLSCHQVLCVQSKEWSEKNYNIFHSKAIRTKTTCQKNVLGRHHLVNQLSASRKMLTSWHLDKVIGASHLTEQFTAILSRVSNRPPCHMCFEDEYQFHDIWVHSTEASVTWNMHSWTNWFPEETVPGEYCVHLIL